MITITPHTLPEPYRTKYAALSTEEQQTILEIITLLNKKGQMGIKSQETLITADHWFGIRIVPHLIRFSAHLSKVRDALFQLGDDLRIEMATAILDRPAYALKIAQSVKNYIDKMYPQNSGKKRNTDFYLHGYFQAASFLYLDDLLEDKEWFERTCHHFRHEEARLEKDKIDKVLHQDNIFTPVYHRIMKRIVEGEIHVPVRYPESFVVWQQLCAYYANQSRKQRYVSIQQDTKRLWDHAIIADFYANKPLNGTEEKEETSADQYTQHFNSVRSALIHTPLDLTGRFAQLLKLFLTYHPEYRASLLPPTQQTILNVTPFVILNENQIENLYPRSSNFALSLEDPSEDFSRLAALDEQKLMRHCLDWISGTEIYQALQLIPLYYSQWSHDTQRQFVTSLCEYMNSDKSALLLKLPLKQSALQDFCYFLIRKIEGHGWGHYSTSVAPHLLNTIAKIAYPETQFVDNALDALLESFQKIFHRSNIEDTQRSLEVPDIHFSYESESGKKGLHQLLWTLEILYFKASPAKQQDVAKELHMILDDSLADPFTAHANLFLYSIQQEKYPLRDYPVNPVANYCSVHNPELLVRCLNRIGNDSELVLTWKREADSNVQNLTNTHQLTKADNFKVTELKLEEKAGELYSQSRIAEITAQLLKDTSEKPDTVLNQFVDIFNNSAKVKPFSEERYQQTLSDLKLMLETLKASSHKLTTKHFKPMIQTLLNHATMMQDTNDETFSEEAKSHIAMIKLTLDCTPFSLWKHCIDGVLYPLMIEMGKTSEYYNEMFDAMLTELTFALPIHRIETYRKTLAAPSVEQAHTSEQNNHQKLASMG